MSEDRKLKRFIADLRRILYLSEIYAFNLADFKEGDLCPTYLKVDIGNIQNSIKRLFTDMMHKSKPETWEKVKMELNREELHDINNLIDAVCGVSNVGEIVDVINAEKKAVIDSPRAEV